MAVELTPGERAAALRFCESFQDNEGYDVPKPMMKRLAALGLVIYKGFGRYEQTEAIAELESEYMTQQRIAAGLPPH
jgi:hypothetical protein